MLLFHCETMPYSPIVTPANLLKIYTNELEVNKSLSIEERTVYKRRIAELEDELYAEI